MIVKNRIKKYSEFQKVIAAENVKKTCFFVSYSLANDLGYSRFGISVPKKIGTAVIRNKIKRQIRAILAKELDMNSSFDYIFIARRSYDINKFNETASDIVSLLKKVGK